MGHGGGGGGGGQRRSWFDVSDHYQPSSQSMMAAYHQQSDVAAAACIDPSIEMPIELRHLDSEEDVVLLPVAIGDRSVAVEEQQQQQQQQHQQRQQPSSSSVSPSLARQLSSSNSIAAGSTTSSGSVSAAGGGGHHHHSMQQQQQQQQQRSSTGSGGSTRSLSSLSELLHSLPVSVSSWLKNRLSEEGGDPGGGGGGSLSPNNEMMMMSDQSSNILMPSPQLSSDAITPPPPPPVIVATAAADSVNANVRLRPMLTKQKKAVQIFESYCEEDHPSSSSSSSNWLSVPKPILSRSRHVRKQGSMNDSLLSAGRVAEREQLKRSLPPRQTTWSGYSTTATSPLSQESSPKDQESSPSSPSSLHHSPPSSIPLILPLSPSPPPPPPPPPPPLPPPTAATAATANVGELNKDFSSIRNGFVRVAQFWQSLRGGESANSSTATTTTTTTKPWLLSDSPTEPCPPPSASSMQHRPSLLEKRIKSFCGWGSLAVFDSEPTAAGGSKAASPSPRRIPAPPPGEEDFFNFALPRCCADQDLYSTRHLGGGSGGPPHGHHPHRLGIQHYQREEGSSTESSSLQSDTSVDSEDSLVSVIFVPRPEGGRAAVAIDRGGGGSLDKSRTSSSSSSTDGSSPKILGFPGPVLVLPATVTELPDNPPATTGTATIHTVPASKKEEVETTTTSDVLSNVVKEGAKTAALVRQSGVQQTIVPRLYCFDVFNPETDDLDSDSECSDDNEDDIEEEEEEEEEEEDEAAAVSSSSSSSSAGSVISVGDPMWPAFQDRRQTILSGSSLEIQTSSCCDLAGSDQLLNCLMGKQDSVDSCPPSIEADLTSSIALPSSASVSGVSGRSGSLTHSESAESSASGTAVLLQRLSASAADCASDAAVEDWRQRSSLGVVDECRDEEELSVELLGELRLHRPSTYRQQQQQQASSSRKSSASASVQSFAWREKQSETKSSFSISTSSLDSSVSAPSFSSARQSSSASAVSSSDLMFLQRKDSEESSALMPLIRPPKMSSTTAAAIAAAAAATTAALAAVRSASPSSHLHHHHHHHHHHSEGGGQTDGRQLCFPHSSPSSGHQQRIADRNTASVSTSQDSESLPSEAGQSGRSTSVTLHRYYHVFRQGELDQLIERYVENLHIISSYYDHANWCVVAEKVHVWTI